jgi:hypothetical protein
MVSLNDLGFFIRETVETIVSTYSEDGQPNAAPMGVVMENEEHVIIKLFNSSQTYKNLQEKRSAVINITTDVELFYRTAFKEANPNGTLSNKLFEKAEIVEAPKLRTSDAAIEILIETLSPINFEKTQATCYVRFIKSTNSPPKAYSRALSATVEAIVHATRIKVFFNNNQKEKVPKLLSIINDCRNTVQKTAPNSRYSEIIEDIMKRIEIWKKQISDNSDLE